MPGGIKKSGGPRAPREASAAGPASENESMATIDIHGLCPKKGKSTGTSMAIFNEGGRSGQKTKAPITILACLEPINHLFPSRRLDGRYALLEIDFHPQLSGCSPFEKS